MTSKLSRHRRHSFLPLRECDQQLGLLFGPFPGFCRLHCCPRSEDRNLHQLRLRFGGDEGGRPSLTSPDLFVVLPVRIVVVGGPSVHDRLAVLTCENLRLHRVASFFDSAVTNAASAGKEYNEVAGRHANTRCESIWLSANP